MENKKHKTILITGTAGFIGFHTARVLLEKGAVIVGVDNVNDYYDPKLKEKRNEILKGYQNYSFYKEDIGDYNALEKIVKKEQPKVIIHLAAQAGVRYSLTNPWAYANSNYIGTLNVFEAAKNHSVRRVLFASSGSVYGSNKPPFSEEVRTDTPISIYGATKKANEVLAYTYHHLYGIETAGLRFFTVYGTYGRPDLALFKFTKNILLEKPIQVYNKGQMTRTFTHIDDIVSGILKLIEKEELNYRIYNLSGEEPVELSRFVELIEKRLSKKANIEYMPIQPGDVKDAVAETTRAEKELGYFPQKSIIDGVNEFIDWFVENKDWLLALKEGE